jgi:regulator of PEP synthase PpsR (kinase-PPPase family)
MSQPRKYLHAHIISDATGIAAERAARAALVQFHRRYETLFVRHAFLKTPKQLSKVLDLAESQNGVVVYSMVHKSLRDWLDHERLRRSIPIVDILGPILHQVGQRFKVKPVLDRALLRRVLGDASMSLAESIDFTLRHDDGLGEETLGKADIILMGVSRTSKTPTSLYISCNHNQRVANIPLILGIRPPNKVFQLKKPHIVGLTIDPEKLALIRRGRFKDSVVEGYSDVPTIMRELAFAHEIFASIRGIRIIDVTDRPIEEVASMIVT